MRTIIFNGCEGPELQPTILSLADHIKSHTSLIALHQGRKVYPELESFPSEPNPTETLIAQHCFESFPGGGSLFALSSRRTFLRIIVIGCEEDTLIDIKDLLLKMSKNVGKRMGTLICRVHILNKTKAVSHLPGHLERHTMTVDTTPSAVPNAGGSHKRPRETIATDSSAAHHLYVMHVMASYEAPESLGIHLRGILGIRYGVLQGVPLKVGNEKTLTTLEFSYSLPDGYEDVNLAMLRLAPSQKKDTTYPSPGSFACVPIRLLNPDLPQSKAVERALNAPHDEVSGRSPVLFLVPGGSRAGALLLGKSEGAGLYVAVPSSASDGLGTYTLQEHWNLKRAEVTDRRVKVFGEDHGYNAYALKRV